MKYYKYNKRFYRIDNNNKIWVHDPDHVKFNSKPFRMPIDVNWRLCHFWEMDDLKHQIKRKRASEKTEAEIFVEIL